MGGVLPDSVVGLFLLTAVVGLATVAIVRRRHR